MLEVIKIIIFIMIIQFPWNPSMTLCWCQEKNPNDLTLLHSVLQPWYLVLLHIPAYSFLPLGLCTCCFFLLEFLSTYFEPSSNKKRIVLNIGKEIKMLQSQNKGPYSILCRNLCILSRFLQFWHLYILIIYCILFVILHL